MSPIYMSRRGSRILLFWVVACLVVLVDQATKTAVRVISPQPGRMGTLIPGLLDLVHVENTGAAFSIGEGAGSLFIVIALLVSVAGFAFICMQDTPLPLTVSIACVVGGGIGNMVDRIMRGSVTDFIVTTFMDFPVFNVADIAVTCGIAVAFVCYVMWERSLAEEGRA